MPLPPDGLIIRPVSLADVDQLHELLTLPGTTWGTNQSPTQTIEQVRSRLEDTLANPSSHELVAELEGKVVGSASLHVRSRKQRYTGSIGITVHDAYVNRGIGRALMEALLERADNALGLKRVELDVIADNASAIHLYDSLGFEREGVRRAALLRDGVFVDLLMMGRVRE